MAEDTSKTTAVPADDAEDQAAAEVVEPTADDDGGDLPDYTVPEIPGADRRGWVWVQNEAGRRYDVREDRLQYSPGVVPVKGVPKHYGPVARQPKARVELSELTSGAAKKAVRGRR